jgi:hypothetical protein
MVAGRAAMSWALLYTITSHKSQKINELQFMFTFRLRGHVHAFKAKNCKKWQAVNSHKMTNEKY